jgi:DNA-binding CsgD family transcriptional regulator
MYDTQMDGHGSFDDAFASPAGYANALRPSAVPGGSAGLHSGILVSLLDEIDYGLIVLGADAKILHANQLARQELGAERFLRRRQGRLGASSARHGAKLDAALASIHHGQRSLLALNGCDGELALPFVPLSAGAPSAAPDAPFALVVLGKRDACEALTLRHYGQIHGLTGAEQALLPAIMRGSSVGAIAQQQRVALCTVRTQLGSIREKTGAASLRVLMARLTSLPPIRPLQELLQAH